MINNRLIAFFCVYTLRYVRVCACEWCVYICLQFSIEIRQGKKSYLGRISISIKIESISPKKTKQKKCFVSRQRKRVFFVPFIYCEKILSDIFQLNFIKS